MGIQERIVKRKGDDRIRSARRQAQKTKLLNLFYQPELINGIRALDKDESTHALRVLRLKPGTTFQATDGKGSFYDCVITGDKKGICQFEVQSTRSVPRQKHQIHIGIAPTKNHDRLEWFVEKATEIGIDRIIPLQCEHNERKKINDERLQKVAVSAMKQSLKAWLPEVLPLTTFKLALAEAADQKFIAHLDDPPAPHLFQAAAPGDASLVLIGPEGDFTNEEVMAAISQGFRKVSLGPHRLRTETAALAACHTLNVVNRT